MSICGAYNKSLIGRGRPPQRRLPLSSFLWWRLRLRPIFKLVNYHGNFLLLLLLRRKMKRIPLLPTRQTRLDPTQPTLPLGLGSELRRRFIISFRGLYRPLQQPRVEEEKEIEEWSGESCCTSSWKGGRRKRNRISTLLSLAEQLARYGIRQSNDLFQIRLYLNNEFLFYGTLTGVRS